MRALALCPCSPAAGSALRERWLDSGQRHHVCECLLCVSFLLSCAASGMSVRARTVCCIEHPNGLRGDQQRLPDMRWPWFDDQGGVTESLESGDRAVEMPNTVELAKALQNGRGHRRRLTVLFEKVVDAQL